MNGHHSDTESFEKRFTEGWNYKTKHGATSLLNGFTSFKFFLLIGTYSLLHALVGANIRLQGLPDNTIKAYDDISGVIEDIKDVKTTKSNVDGQ